MGRPSNSPRSEERPRPANQVTLSGRLTGVEPRTLPSGDEILAIRVVVRRDRPGRPGRPGRPTVDTIDCTIWRADLRRRVRSWQPGDAVVLEGALRRRFWRSGSGARSRYDVEVSRIRRAR